MLSYFVNFGVNKSISSTSSTQWRVPFALQMLPGTLLLAGIFFQNESPRWLVEKNKIEAARKALAQVRARAVDDPEVTRELDEIVEDFNGQEKMPLMAQIRATCSSSRNFYTFSMAVVLMFWQQWTGMSINLHDITRRLLMLSCTGTNSINYYSPQIFKSVGLTGTSAGLFATGIYGVVKVVITALGLMFATEQLGRKWSLIIGGCGQAFAMYYSKSQG